MILLTLEICQFLDLKSLTLQWKNIMRYFWYWSYFLAYSVDVLGSMRSAALTIWPGLSRTMPRNAKA